MKRCLFKLKCGKCKSLKKRVKIEPIKLSKKAILIGLNYPGSYYELNGCINDVNNGARYLKEYGYDTKTLVDKDLSENYNVLEALNELKDHENKTVFFHYSGHGSQTKDLNNDEEDGLDELLYSKGNVQITDDNINKVLRNFSKDKTVFLVFDCCHSGTIADLPYNLTTNKEKGVQEKDSRNPNKDSRNEEALLKTIQAKVICISGCRDDQVSADISERDISYGALSATLYNILRKHKNDVDKITWRKLYIELLYEMVNKGYSQIPSISASDPSLFDSLVEF